MKFTTLVNQALQYLMIDMFIAVLKVQIGAQYRMIGLISESNSVFRALNDIFGRIMVCFKPKKAIFALVFSVYCVVVNSPELCRIILR